MNRNKVLVEEIEIAAKACDFRGVEWRDKKRLDFDITFYDDDNHSDPFKALKGIFSMVVRRMKEEKRRTQLLRERLKDYEWLPVRLSEEEWLRAIGTEIIFEDDFRKKFGSLPFISDGKSELGCCFGIWYYFRNYLKQCKEDGGLVKVECDELQKILNEISQHLNLENKPNLLKILQQLELTWTA